MARATGFICDVCEEFVTTPDQSRPRGWMRLDVETGETGNNGFDLCSNKCLKKLGTERVAAERETEPLKKVDAHKFLPGAVEGPNGKTYTPQNHSRWHKDAPEPNCAYCQAETDPDRELAELVEDNYA